MTKVKTQNKSIRKRSITDDFGLHTNNFSLLHSPGRQLCPFGKELFGVNLVSNGDFRDFTMEDDANTVGHWIFDKSYEREDKNKYIGSERSGIETTRISGDFVDTNEDGVADNWNIVYDVVATGEVLSSMAGFTGSVQKISKIITGTLNLLNLDYNLVMGTWYRLKFKVSGTLENFNIGTGNYYTVSPVTTITPTSTPTMHDVIFAPTGAFDLCFYKTGAALGDFYIGELELTELPANSLRPLNFSDGFEDEYTTNPPNPAYQNGGVLEFNGSDQHLYIPNADADDFDPGTGNFTIETWIKTSKTGVFQYIFDNYDGDGYLVRILDNNKLDFYLRITVPSGDARVTSTNTITDGNWHHIAAVKNNGILKLYIDAIDVGEQTGDDPTGWSLSSTNNVGIGKSVEHNDYYFNGFISEVRYSNVARTADEIRYSYGLGKGWINQTHIVSGIENINFAQGFNSQSTGRRAYQGLGAVVGSLYRTDFDLTLISGTGDIYIRENVGTGDIYGRIQPTETGSYHFYWRNANDTTPFLLLSNVTSFDGSWDNISTHEVITPPVSNFAEDFSRGGAKYGTEISIGTLTSGLMYLITVTEVDHFGTGLVVGDYFVSAGTETCDANNKVKEVTNGNHGIMKNDLEDDQPTYPFALEYDGVDQYIDFGNILFPTDGANNDKAFVVAGWIKADTATNFILIQNGEWTVDAVWSFNTTAGDALNIAIYDESANAYLIQSFAGYGATFGNDWHFITGVYDGSATVGGLKIYIDDVLQTTSPLTTGTYIGMESPSTAQALFGANNAFTIHSDGKIGDAGIIIFDGNAGRPSSLPSNYTDWISRIYNATKWKYKN